MMHDEAIKKSCKLDSTTTATNKLIKYGVCVCLLKFVIEIEIFFSILWNWYTSTFNRHLSSQFEFIIIFAIIIVMINTHFCLRCVFVFVEGLGSPFDRLIFPHENSMSFVFTYTAQRYEQSSPFTNAVNLIHAVRTHSCHILGMKFRGFFFFCNRIINTNAFKAMSLSSSSSKTEYKYTRTHTHRNSLIHSHERTLACYIEF